MIATVSARTNMDHFHAIHAKTASLVMDAFVKVSAQWIFPLSDKILTKIETGKNITIA